MPKSIIFVYYHDVHKCLAGKHAKPITCRSSVAKYHALNLNLALLLPVAADTARAQEAVKLQRKDQTITAVMAYAPMGGSWQTRTEPYRDMQPGCKWLAVIYGVTHMNLDGVQRGNCRAPRAHPGMTLASE